MKKKIKTVVTLAAFSAVFVVAYGNGKTAAVSQIISLKSFANNIMQMVVNTTDPTASYPKATSNLVNAVWTSVPHSDNGANAFVVTNLSYSTADGSNNVIYVQASDAVQFYGIGGQ